MKLVFDLPTILYNRFQQLQLEFGWKLHGQAGIPAWMIVYFVLSMAFAFALKGRFGVTF